MAGHRPEQGSAGDYLYHYTTTAGLIGIVSTHRLRLTSAGFLNDEEELVYGSQIAAAALRRQADATHNLSDALSGAVRDQLYSCAIALEDRVMSELPFVASFSERRDDLSQWRGYAADGGYCIAFHRETLGQFLSPVPEGPVLGVPASTIPALNKVAYGDDSVPSLERAAQQARAALSAHGVPAQDNGVATYHLLRQLVVPSLVLAKHPAFEAENEWRISVLDAGPVKFRETKYGPAPYAEIEFDPRAIVEVLVGPGPGADRRERAAATLLRHTAGCESALVTQTTAPYLG